MRIDVEQFLRGKIRDGLAECTPSQRDLFLRAYGGEEDGPSVDELEHALALVERTLIKNANKEG
jgi:hypothetical protein